MATKIDLTGMKINNLFVINETEKKHNRTTWKCKCDCGNFVNVTGKDLRTGHTKSCGCLLAKKTKERCLTHGQSSRKNTSITYKTWAAMKQRCLNENSANFKYYGGRGIKICEQWMTFDGFFADMGEREKGYELDRIDGNGNYEKSNCRWVNHIKNCNNKNNQTKIPFNGEEKTLSEWAKIYKINQSTLYKRVFYKKMPINEALGVKYGISCTNS